MKAVKLLMQIALKLMLMYLSLFLLVLESNSHRISFRGWTEGGKMMAAGSLAGLGCSRARTVLTYLDKERVKLGDSRVDGSWLLGWPTNWRLKRVNREHLQALTWGAAGQGL